MDEHWNLAVCQSIDLATSALGQDRRQWVHICPKGRIDTRDERGPYFLENPAKVIEACRERQGKAKMLVDYDHQSVTSAPQASRAEAAGWIEGMQARADGIWALVEWTVKAAAHIASREYRYLSPVMIVTPDMRVAAIQNVALTNSPNLHELTALSREETPLMKTPSDPRENLDQRRNPNPASREDTTDFSDAEMSFVRQLLDLPPNALPSEVIAAIKALVTQKQSSAPDPSRYVPIGEFERAVAEANSLRQGITRTDALQHVENTIRDRKMVPALRDWGVQLCTVNKPAFDAFIARTGPALAPLFTSIVPSSYTAHSTANDVGEVEADVCKRMGLTPEQFKAAR